MQFLRHDDLPDIPDGGMQIGMGFQDKEGAMQRMFQHFTVYNLYLEKA